MKIITIPKNVELTISVKRNGFVQTVKKETDFKAFLSESLSGFELFKKGSVNARLFNKLMLIIEEITPTQIEVKFEDEDFKKVKDAVAVADWLSADINRTFIPFYDAVETAKDQANPNK